MQKLLTIVIVLLTFFVRAQDVSSVFTNETIVYYGIDFSNAYLIGDFGNGDGTIMRDKMFREWNDLVVKESKKYNIARSFKKTSVYYDLAPVSAENQKRDPSTIRKLNDVSPLSSDQIQQMVRDYTPGEKHAGTALVFIVESFNKHTETALVHVTLFDIVSRQILITEKMMGVPQGIGLRNYWANSIASILKTIDEVKYSQWKKRYYQK